jgi:hypothetical protein
MPKHDILRFAGRDLGGRFAAKLGASRMMPDICSMLERIFQKGPATITFIHVNALVLR